MNGTVTLWTVGHANHSLKAFSALLGAAAIDGVVDVRSFPHPQFATHFNRDALRASVKALGLSYSFLGQALGGSPRSEDQYDEDGHALYEEMARMADFVTAIDDLVVEASERRLALMCACRLPDECHRRLLVGKVLCERGAMLCHLLPDGTTHTETQVLLPSSATQLTLLGENRPPWRSARPVSRKQRREALSTD
jgi:uncharacterized protein (DUF488 family)